MDTPLCASPAHTAVLGTWGSPGLEGGEPLRALYLLDGISIKLLITIQGQRINFSLKLKGAEGPHSAGVCLSLWGPVGTWDRTPVPEERSSPNALSRPQAFALSRRRLSLGWENCIFILETFRAKTQVKVG